MTNMQVWKSPRRKLYAVLSNNTSDGDDTPLLSKKSRQVSDSDDDFELPTKKTKDDKLETLLHVVGSIKESLSDIFSLSENSRVPLGLKCVVRDTFECTICRQVPIHSPVITTKYCKTILGCDTCVNTWYSGPEMLTKTCPSCRAKRGCKETMVLRGLEDFLAQMSKLLQNDEVEEAN